MYIKISHLATALLSLFLLQSCEKNELDYVDVSYYKINSNGQLKIVGDFQNWKTMNIIVESSEAKAHLVYVDPSSFDYFSKHNAWNDETVLINPINQGTSTIEVYVRSKKNFPDSLDNWEIFSLEEGNANKSIANRTNNSPRCASCHDHPLVGPNN